MKRCTVEHLNFTM